MDELEALRILRGEKTPEAENTEETSEKKKRGPLPALVLIIFILLTYLMTFVIAYNVNVHPLDRILIKMAVLKNYSITLTVGTDSVTMVVDGNIMYYDGNYYETVGDETYHYYVNAFGKWEKKKLSQSASTGGVDSSLLETILDKESYQLKLFNIGEFKMLNNLHPNDIRNITTTVRLGQLNSTGRVYINQYFGQIVQTVHIRISSFGLSKLKLPEID